MLPLMLVFHFKRAIKSLVRNKAISLFNMLWFGFGISVCIAVTVNLLYEFSYNRFHQNYTQKKRLVNEENSSRIDYRAASRNPVEALRYELR